MGSSINEVVLNKDSVTVYAEGEFIIYILVGGKLECTAFSKNYFDLFRFRFACRMEHEEAVLKALSENGVGLPKAKIKSGREKKEEVDIYQLFKNSYPINLASFPIGEDGEYIGYRAADIADCVSSLFRNEKRNGIAKPDFKEITDRAFKELGFVGKNPWVVRSALSKEIWRRRKAKAAAIARRKIEEARQAEFGHLLFPEN